MTDSFALLVTCGICAGTLLMVLLFFVVIFWQESQEFKEHPVIFPKKHRKGVTSHPMTPSTTTKSFGDDASSWLSTSVTASTITLEMSSADDFGSRGLNSEEGQGQEGDLIRKPLNATIGYDNPALEETASESESESQDFTQV